LSVLADSSVWVRYLRQGHSGEAGGMEALLRAAEVVTCGPVTAELLVGASSARRTELGSLLDALPWVDLRRPEWRRVGHVGALLRERGATVALTDIEIAVAAEAADAALWTFDSDFQRIAAVMPNLRFFAPVK
jgi:predicted nucleic acid-binding protein